MENNLRHIRESKGFSQKYVAKRLGKSQPSVSKIENGYTHLSNQIIDEISKILEVPKEKLFDEENEQMLSTNSSVSNLLDELTENRKLLREVEINQEKLQQQLNVLLSKLIEK